jgi:hypothetical protein
MEVSRFDTYSPRQRVIVTVAGYTIVDIAIQDKSVPTLNTGQHAAVRGDLAAAGRDGLWDMPEDIRYAFERLRTGNLPVMFQWHAIGTPAGWATETDFGVGSPNGDQRGIWVTSTDLVNCFDSTVTARTASSIGFVCPACYTGIGHEDKAAGQSIGVKLSILAAATGGATAATVRLEGPTHVASNYVDISIPTGETAAWYTSGTLLRLNTMSEDADTSTARNKVDALAKVATAGDNLYIYAIKGEMYIP